MGDEKSCGAVVFTRQNGSVQYLLVQQTGGNYSFPKGHMEQGETELQTAVREIMEETGLEVDFVPGFRAEDAYWPHEKPGTLKEVVYFLAEFCGQAYHFQESEIIGGGLYTFEKAVESFQFESSRRILREADGFLREKCCLNGHPVV